MMMWIALYSLAIFSLVDAAKQGTNVLKIASYRLQGKEDTPVEKLDFAFDGIRSTSGAIYTKMIQIVLTLEDEFQVDRVEIIGDSTSDVYTARVGFRTDNESSLYNCSLDSSGQSTVCVPLCGETQGNSNAKRPGTLGRYLYLNLERDVARWSRIYEVTVRGQKVNRMKDDLEDVGMLAPFELDTCANGLWQITGPGLPAKISTALPKELNMTIFFGKLYGVVSVGLVVSPEVKSLDVTLIGLMGKQRAVTLKLGSCTQLSCPLIESDAKFPADRIVVRPYGVQRLRMLAKLFYHPQISVTKSTDPETDLTLTCSVTPCDPTVHYDSCKRPGLPVSCASLRLLRQEAGEGQVIVGQGKVSPEWAAQTEFRIDKVTGSQLDVIMPRTYQYYGKYQCSCISDDAVASVINSPLFNLTWQDFSRALVFLPEHSYKYKDLTYNVSGGIIELSDHDDGYFELKILGHTTSDKQLSLSTSLFVDGQLQKKTVDLSFTPVEVKAFPQLANSWSFQIYSTTANSPIYPDIKQENLLRFQWSRPDRPGDKVQMEKFAVVVNTQEHLLMGWLWERTPYSLDMRVYSQSGTAGVVQLTVNSCLQKNAVIATANFSGVGCLTTASSPVTLTCNETRMGYLAKFTLVPQVLASYALVAASNKNTLATSEASKPDELMKDLTIRTEIESLSGSPDNSDDVVMEVAFVVASKLVMDQISCGSVVATVTMETGKPPTPKVMKNVLSQLVFKQQVTLPRSQPSLTVTISIEVETLKLTETRAVRVDNPLMSSIELSKENAKPVKWQEISKNAWTILIGYNVTIVSNVKVCGPNPPVSFMVPKAEKYRARTWYEAKAPDFPKDIAVSHTVTVQSVFRGSNNDQKLSGQPNSTTLQMEQKSGTTSLTLTGVSKLPREQSIEVIPGETSPCGFTSVQFTLTTPKEPELGVKAMIKRLREDDPKEQSYKISDLLPGRYYNLQAAVTYRTGKMDVSSAKLEFSTVDELSIPLTLHTVEVGSEVHINCTGALGPEGPYKKRLEWRQSDGAKLPESTTSIFLEDQNIATLRIGKAEPGHTGSYGCFISPQDQKMPVVMKLEVNDIFVDEKSLPFTADQPAELQCSSSLPGELIWTGADNKPVPAGSASTSPSSEAGEMKKMGQDILVEHQDLGGERKKVVLRFSKMALKYTGRYACQRREGGRKKEVDVRLQESIRIEELPDSSGLSGRYRKLRCTGQLGIENRYFYWEPRSNGKGEETKGKPGLPYLDLVVRNSPESAGSYRCVIKGPAGTGAIQKSETAATFNNNIERNAKVLTPATNKPTVNGTMQLKCEVYPSSLSDQIVWTFVPVGNTVGNATGSSSNSNVSMIARRTNEVVATTGDKTTLCRLLRITNGYESGQWVSVLVVDRVSMENRGSYTCRVEGKIPGRTPRMEASPGQVVSIDVGQESTSAVVMPVMNDSGSANLSPSPFLLLLATAVLLTSHS